MQHKGITSLTLEGVNNLCIACRTQGDSANRLRFAPSK